MLFVERVLRDKRLRPIEVAAVRDDELDLVPRPEELQVVEVVPGFHSRARTLHVHDLDDARIHAVEREVPAGLDEHGVAAVAEGRGEREEGLLFEWLAARQLDERNPVALHLREDLVDGARRPARERVGAIAPDAPEGAPGQSHERARQPGEGRFPLEAAEDLGDDEGRRSGGGGDHAPTIARAPIIEDVRLKLELAYLGTSFEGWQVQAPRAGGALPRTVQGELEDSLKGIYGAPIRIHGAGRTDSGVHAEAQVAHFDVPEGEGVPLLPSKKIPRVLNSKLPEDVRVVSVSEASPDFHARHSATGKVYVYRLRRGDTLHPHRGLVEALASERLDVEAMRAAAACLVGTRDFAPFSLTGSDPGTTVRTLARLGVEERGSLLVITAAGNGFLRGMVRRLVGTLRDAGRGRFPAPEAAFRPGPTAEARGLTLERVLYPPESLPWESGGPAAALVSSG